MDKLAAACRDLVQAGVCRADCCGAIPMQRSLVAKHEDLIAVDYTDTMPDHEEYMFPVTDDLMCIFLDGVARECVIHDESPDVCRKFGDESHTQMCCPYLRGDGTPRTASERKRVQWAASAGQAKLNGILNAQRQSLMTN